MSSFPGHRFLWGKWVATPNYHRPELEYLDGVGMEPINLENNRHFLNIQQPRVPSSRPEPVDVFCEAENRSKAISLMVPPSADWPYHTPVSPIPFPFNPPVPSFSVFRPNSSLPVPTFSSLIPPVPNLSFEFSSSSPTVPSILPYSTLNNLSNEVSSIVERPLTIPSSWETAGASHRCGAPQIEAEVFKPVPSSSPLEENLSCSSTPVCPLEGDVIFPGPDECWNCLTPGHQYTVCLHPRRKFRFGCGYPHKTVRTCPRCQPEWLLGRKRRT